MLTIQRKVNEFWSHTSQFNVVLYNFKDLFDTSVDAPKPEILLL